MWLRACLLLVLASACDFSTTIGDEIDGQRQMLVDDDLTGGTVRDGVIAGGNVEPDGFVLGGLHARGFQTTLVDNGEDFAKILADAAAATETGAGYTQVPENWMGGRPHGLGLTADGNYSVIYDGEILLPKGEVTLEVDVDDRALVEVLGKTVANSGSVTLMVPDSGWYPIRAAMTQAGGNSRFVLTLVQGQVQTPVDASRLRARVTSDRGLVVFVFDGQGFVGAHGQTARPTIAENYGGLAPPFDLTTSFDRFSLRFAGQLRIDTPGHPAIVMAPPT